ELAAVERGVADAGEPALRSDLEGDEVAARTGDDHADVCDLHASPCVPPGPGRSGPASGAGPVEARTISAESRTWRGASASRSASTASRVSTAARPARSPPRSTVVSAGVAIAAKVMLSKPATLIRPGTGTPRSASRASTPSAITSL